MYRIRALNFEAAGEGEVYMAASFSMLTLLESLPEARRDPTCVPGFSIEEMATQYQRGRSDPEHLYLVAVDDADQPVGHAIALMRTDAENVRYGYSYTRYILPAHRQRGLARRLLREAMGWWATQGAAYVLAHTHPTNLPLQTLFLSSGFSVIAHKDGRWPSVLLRCEGDTLRRIAPLAQG